MIAALDPASLAHAATVARACPVCGAERARRLFDNAMCAIDRFDFSYPVVACATCDMVYAGRSLDEAAMADYYRALSKYDASSDASAFDLHRAHAAAAFARRWASDDVAVLDVGCSTGIFLTELVAAGCRRVVGVEPAPGAVEVARSRGLDVTCGDALAYPDYARFGVVTLLAVLEHLFRPRVFFERLTRECRSGTVVIVEVPDADAFGDYLEPGVCTEPFGEFSIEHINFFGEASLARLGAEVGLSMIATERITYLNGWAGVFVAFRKDASADVEPWSRATSESVERYIARSAAAMLTVDARLQEFVMHDRQVVVYGAGSHTARLLARPALADLALSGIVDRNPNLVGRIMAGATIALPESIPTFDGYPVVVSTFNARAAIRDYLDRHFDNPVIDLYPMAS